MLIAPLWRVSGSARTLAGLATTIGLLALPGPAMAHHPMGGALPATWMEGLLSGLGHPVIGLDHLAFLVAAGVLAAGCAGATGALLPMVFLAGGLAGTLLHVGGVGLGPAELLAVPLSLLAVGGLLLLGRRGAAPAPLLAALFAAAGLVHGHAFAESVVGAEATPVLAYLIGLMLVQAAIAYAAFLLARRMAAAGAAPRLARWAGATACGIGVLAAGLTLAGA